MPAHPDNVVRVGGHSACSASSRNPIIATGRLISRPIVEEGRSVLLGGLSFVVQPEIVTSYLGPDPPGLTCRPQ